MHTHFEGEQTIDVWNQIAPSGMTKTMQNFSSSYHHVMYSFQSFNCVKYHLTKDKQLLQSDAFVFLPSGGKHHAVIPKTQGHGFWIFPLFSQIAFSLLGNFPSFPQTAAVHTFTFLLLFPFSMSSCYSRFTRKSLKAAARVAGCRVQYTLFSPSVRVVAVHSKAQVVLWD